MKRVSGSVLFAILLAVRASSAADRVSPFVSSDGLWRNVTQQEIGAQASGDRLLFPNAYRLVHLDVGAFQNLAANAPLEFTPGNAGAEPVMTLPMPDGSFARFRVEESPMMEPDLAAQLPDVKTYRAEGIDIPEATARLDFTPEGFHGFVLAPAGTVYIDPYRKGDTENYISYWRDDYARPAAAAPFHCDFAPPAATSHTAPAASEALAAARGETLRTYRLALACTGEYAAYYGGTVAGAQAGMVTTMNRVNGVYEKDLAVRMVMVNNTSICFTNAGSDPYANDSNDLDVNQPTIDTLIGSANYDIGHLLGTGGGGVAYLGVVCDVTAKAGGLTGSSGPIGDAFDIDYVAHEMGHQFGAGHTFNGTTSSCGGGNRDSLDAYEPGSGATIMGYAGICGAEDLQPHSDAYFHTKSFDEIVAFTNTISCASQTPSGNVPPVPAVGPAVTIPASTPFYLTGSATDADGDPLTYCWEEFDLGTASPPSTDNGSRPIFRSFNPVTTPTRTFPRLSNLLANTTSFGESLPTTTRAMTFRLTARDNRTGANRTSTTVSVTSAAGPFLVTAPNTNVTWAGGSTQTVTWNVAGTTAAPVSCANVKILFSSDGGNTFPTTLLASTPNDGSQAVTAPAASTSTARVRVECTTAPFFDISNTNFTIATALTVVATATTATNVALTFTAIGGATSYEIYRRDSAGGGYALIGTNTTNSYNDSTAAANTAYLYAVKSVAGGTPSALSSPDLATTVVFTDSTLTAQGTRIKAAHITELRTAVNAVRTLAGAGAYPSFTDPSLVAGGVAKTAHITDLRTALNTALTTLSLPVPSYTDATLTPQVTLIKTSHVVALRNAVK